MLQIKEILVRSLFVSCLDIQRCFLHSTALRMKFSRACKTGGRAGKQPEQGGNHTHCSGKTTRYVSTDCCEVLRF